MHELAGTIQLGDRGVLSSLLFFHLLVRFGSSSISVRQHSEMVLPRVTWSWVVFFSHPVSRCDVRTPTTSVRNRHPVVRFLYGCVQHLFITRQQDSAGLFVLRLFAKHSSWDVLTLLKRRKRYRGFLLTREGVGPDTETQGSGAEPGPLYV